MAEQTPADTSPEEYRGGAPEPEAKGIVTDDVKDDQPPDTSDPQELGNESHGDFPERNAEDRIDTSAGDNADATSMGSSGGARGSDAGLGRHEDAKVDEDDPDQSIEGGN